METERHTFSDLFAQLGLPADAAAIEQFIRVHTPLPADILLHQAPFWTPSQAAFLSTELQEDADWAATVDQLNLQLRKPQ